MFTRGAGDGRRASTTASTTPTTTRKPLRGDIPILIGGSGERKTLRLVAQYADGCNLFGDAERVRHLLGVLERHCEDVGRDPAEITKTRDGVDRHRRDARGRRRAKLDAMRRPACPRSAIGGGDRGRPGRRSPSSAQAFRRCRASRA